MGSDDDINRGRFEGEVMARLNSIVESVRKVEHSVAGLISRMDTKLDHAVFAKHKEESQKSAAQFEKRLATLEKRWWLILGGLSVIGFIWALFQPVVAQAISKIFQT